MKASEVQFISFIQPKGQFSIPIYQRTYSWTKDQCTQLWNDIIKVGRDNSINGHFIGSIVYIAEGIYEHTSVPEMIVIDGQQRLTTLSLFLSALSKVIDEQENKSEISSEEIKEDYLFNRLKKGEQKYKLILTYKDKDTYINLIEGRDPPKEYAPQIIENYNFFLEKIRNSEIPLEQIYKGICKLMIVSISLDRTSDDPQLIFESLNSTGLKLSQADLIRNFVLMGLEKDLQKNIYHNYWYPMEQRFATMEDSKYFDRFMRDYLTVKTGQIPNKGQVYESFKRYWISVRDIPTEKLMDEITRFSKHYANLIFANFEESDINKIAKNINTLKVDVVYPFLLEILEDYKNQVISKSELIEIMNLSESYVFRRAICDVPTSSLNKTFANLTKEIDKDDYLTSLKASFINKRTYKRFPNDDEFKREFVLKNVYNFRIRPYLFSKLENHDHKEPIDTASEYTVEHIMPQNPNLLPEWRQAIGENWQEIHNEFLHTVGNLTLTGYNSELSDRPFLEKRDMKGGFADSHLMINHALSTLETWNKDEIIKRGKDLSELASQIWSAPKLSDEILEKYRAIEEVVDEDEDEDESEGKKWVQILDYAKPEIREIVENMISKIKEKFNCIGEPYGRWYYLYVKEPQEMKNCFAVITCGIGTTNICIRVNPETFSYEDELIRTVKGFFFPEEHERRMSIKPETLEKILTYLVHSVKITKDSD